MFWQNDLLHVPFILTHLRSSILARFCKLKLPLELIKKKKLCILGLYNLPHTEKVIALSFYRQYNVHVQAVSTRPLIGGGVLAGDEAKDGHTCQC